VIQVRQDILDEIDGPMLVHGLQGFHDKTLRVPKRQSWRPNPEFLEERFEHFKHA
jgi:putative restriction endonuclease